MATVLTGRAIDQYRLLVLYRSLAFQVRTGIKMSRISAVAAARRAGYVGRSAKALLEDMRTKHPELTQV